MTGYTATNPQTHSTQSWDSMRKRYSSLLELVKSINSFPLLNPATEADKGKTIPFVHNDAQVGIIHRTRVLPHLKELPECFEVTEERVSFHPSLNTPQLRSKAIDKVLRSWRESQTFTSLKGWREERYSIWGNNGDQVCALERSAVGIFGVRCYGSHLNGYVVDEDGTIKVWVAKRSKTKQTWPGFLDNLTAGGIPHGSTPFLTIKKEANEEASIPVSLSEQIKPVSTIGFLMEHPIRGIIVDTEFCFDLEVPKDFVPTPCDGEVERFDLMDLEQIKELLLNSEFMPESGLVMIDFLIRHGHINSENEKDYVPLCEILRPRIPLAGPRFDTPVLVD